MATTVCLSQLSQIYQVGSLDWSEEQTEASNLRFHHYKSISFRLTKIRVKAFLKNAQMSLKIAIRKITLKSKMSGHVWERPCDK